jgi:cytochrome c
LREIAAKYATRADAEAYLTGKIKSGGQGVWGQIPMPPQTLSDNDAKLLAQWLATGAKK